MNILLIHSFFIVSLVASFLFIPVSFLVSCFICFSFLSNLNSLKNISFFYLIISLLICKFHLVVTRNIGLVQSDDLLRYFEVYELCADVGYSCIIFNGYFFEPVLSIFYNLLPSGLSIRGFLFCNQLLISILLFLIYFRAAKFTSKHVVFFVIILEMFFSYSVSGQLIRQYLATVFLLLLISYRTFPIILLCFTLGFFTHLAFIISFIQYFIIKNISSFKFKSIVKYIPFIVVLIILSLEFLFVRVSDKSSFTTESNISFLKILFLFFGFMYFLLSFKKKVIVSMYFIGVLFIYIISSYYPLVWERGFFMFNNFPFTFFLLVNYLLIQNDRVRYLIHFPGKMFRFTFDGRYFSFTFFILIMILFIYRFISPDIGGAFSPFNINYTIVDFINEL